MESLLPGRVCTVSTGDARRAACLRVASLVVLAGLGAGCGSGVLDPRGPVGRAEKLILLDSAGIMLIVVLPTIVLTLAFAWWFRASNPRASYFPDWAYSGRLEFIVWVIPALIVMFLGGVTWIGSHDFDPYALIPSRSAPLQVQVVSLDWKWLFIYPDLGVASVNELVVPAGRPVHFQLTSSSVMNSFFVPQLGSQIYTMPGMATQLSLLADRPGIYPGLSAQFSGDGFSDMHFAVKAVADADFYAWVSQVRGNGMSLDNAAYGKLARPGTEPAAQTYGSVAAGLFQAVVAGTSEEGGGHMPMPDAPGRMEN